MTPAPPPDRPRELDLKRLAGLLRDWPSYVLMGAGVIVITVAMAERWADDQFHGSDYRWTLAAG